MESLGGIDLIVKQVGIYKEKKLEEMQDEEWKRKIQINMDGVLYM